MILLLVQHNLDKYPWTTVGQLVDLERCIILSTLHGYGKLRVRNTPCFNCQYA